MNTNSPKDCPHNSIENNMMPDTCRDCGKVLQEEVSKWDKDIQKILEEAYSRNDLGEVWAIAELSCLITRVRNQTLEQAAEAIEEIPRRETDNETKTDGKTRYNRSAEQYNLALAKSQSTIRALKK